MGTHLKWVMNKYKDKDAAALKTIVSSKISKEVITFHRSFKEYNKTTLHRLSNLAQYLGVREIYLKDESTRFGLNSFKVLGASYAIGKTLAKLLDKSLSETPFEYLAHEDTKKALAHIKLVATTDGNHGRGVAWTADQLDLEAQIYMPRGTTKNRFDHIAKLGATVEITDYNYDDTIRYMLNKSKGTQNQIIQDTAWQGYDEIPAWIMQGYSTIAQEIIEDLGEELPTHVFLQAGVGAFAGVMSEMLVKHYKTNPPKVIIVEAQNSECFYKSVENNKSTAVTGDLKTIMAGLACGEPNPIAWEILKNQCDAVVAADDSVSATGMRILGNPLSPDPQIISGECGGVTLGVLSLIAKENQYTALKEALEIDQSSRIILVSTEGDTDSNMYRNIVWNGAYPND